MVIFICILMMVISMTFTTTGVADWVPADGHKMHWPQTPDLTAGGVAVEMPLSQIRADDFRCSETGYITGIHIWGSFEQDELPLVGPDGLIFYLTIWENIPAAPGTPYNYSQPGQLLWTMSYGPGTYTIDLAADNTSEGWYDPVSNVYTANDHNDVYLYNFAIPASQAFLQEEGMVYWLGVRQYFTSGGQCFGWKSTDTTLQWNDNAVWMSAAGWLPLQYPAGHGNEGNPLDFAFVINGEPAPPTLTIPPWMFTPLTLNLASKGRWVTAHIELPEGYNGEDIDIDTVRLEDNIPVDRCIKQKGYQVIKQKGYYRVMLKFDRSELEDMISGGASGKPAEFKIAGRFTDGTAFVGYSEPVNVVSGPLDWP